MNKKIKTASVILIGIALSILFSGCIFAAPTLTIYKNSDKYKAGNFRYSAKDIKKVEINWVGGDISITQSTSDTLTASEITNPLATRQKMHYLIDNSTLTIQYAASGYTGNIDSKYKQLKIEIPENINLSINNVSAGIKSDRLSLSELKIANVSGEVNIGDVISSQADIDSVSGSVTLGKAAIKKDIKVITVSAGINTDFIVAEKGKFESVSGNINTKFHKCKDLKIESTSGAVNLSLSDELGAEVDYSTVSGSYSSQRSHKTENSKKIFGDGSCKVKVETISGNLQIN